MVFILSTALIFITISVFLFLLAMILSKKNLQETEKNSVFECGFEPEKFKYPLFSLKFYIITIIFLIFDVEIALLLPLIKSINNISTMIWLNSNLIFLLILILGTLVELNMKSFDWK
uniref:NADH-ubiquinone oxidoreductase chain 3 n=1 Tax=Tachaea chinensis TaxID=1862870 RepID=A0A7L4XR73_9CRUS|nr:NADH dehydrogenase subunit 3 [Tachaea chinensis]ATO58512.1 NADH dehydrogenase subunit 3 [Tachaea chinensis]QGT15731.1 NADH dehydrogenase subunit 3 [Tachaea chinensis]